MRQSLGVKGHEAGENSLLLSSKSDHYKNGNGNEQVTENEIVRRTGYGAIDGHVYESEDEVINGANHTTEDDASAGRDAVAAQASLEKEKELHFKDAIRLYPWAVVWSVVFSLGVVMLAFDPQVMGNLLAMPAFQRHFGVAVEGQYIIPSTWQSALSIGNPLGQCLGALLAGHPMDMYGRRASFAACTLLTSGLVFIEFFATNLQTLLIGELLNGLVLGAFVVIAPAYASEVCPLALRGILTSWTNACFVIGQLLANGVTAATKDLDGRWAYRVPFACQWLGCLIVLPLVLFAPESPWWLVRRGRLSDAADALRRLSAPEVDVKSALAAIIETDKREQSQSTYRDCFVTDGGNLRRTEIGTGVYAIQVFSGIYLIGFGTLFFELAGLNTEQAFNMGVAFFVAGLVGSILSWIIMGFAGRRAIYLHGLAVLAVLQFVIGISASSSYATSKATAWTQCLLMLIWNLVYNISIGPICFVILCEVSAAKARAKVIAIATAVQAALGMAVTLAIPSLMNPDGLDLRGKTGYIWGTLAALSWFWAFVRVPETSGKTYEELDRLFEQGVKARDFQREHRILL
ncbi:MAG: hypothetical protein Q9159_006028 [Coniocarpon cinnabarinum]